MRTQIRQHQSCAVLVLAFFVLAFSGGKIQAQTDSSCSGEGSSRSAKTTQAAKVTLNNQTKETLTVYWLNFEGKRQKWFDLSAGQAFEQSTFVGHLWLVTKPNGQCLAIFSAPGNFVIGKPQSPVNTNRPQQSQNQTTTQPNTSAGGGAQTDKAVLTVSSASVAQPGTANPLAGAGLALFKQSFGEDLRRKGQVPAGSSARLTPLEFWARSCLTPTGNCRQAMTEMRANSVADIVLDANGKATLPGVPPGTYYVYVIARAVPPRAWEQSVELKPGANSVTLDPRNMASLDTILSSNKPPFDVAAKKPSINNPTSKPTITPPSNPAGGSAEAYFAQGEKYLEAKDYAKAVEAYEKAISLKPSWYSPNLGLGVSYFLLNRFQEALTALAKAYRQAPKNAPDLYQIHYWIGMSYLEILADQARRKIFTEEDPLQFATAAFEEAVRLKPDHIASQYQLGWVYRITGEFEEAVKALNTVIRLQPKHVDAHYDLGLAYTQSGKKNEALQVYRKLLTLNKERAQKLYAEINKPK